MTEDISFDFHFDRPIYKISYKKKKKKEKKKKTDKYTLFR